MPSEKTKAIDVFADTEGYATCKGPNCGVKLLWAQVVKTRRKMCFEGDVVPLGSRVEEGSGRLVHEYDFSQNHWAHCPDSRGFKK